MKEIIFPAILSMCMAGAYAQETDAPLSRTIFKLSPQHFTQNSLKAGVERFNQTHSGSVAFFLAGMMENKEQGFYGIGYDGVAGELQLRRYVSPMKTLTSKRNRVYHQGVYGAAYLQGGYYTGNFKGQGRDYDPITSTFTWYEYDYSEDIVNGGFGFTIGYQRTLWQVIFLEAFIGGGIQFARSHYTGTTGYADEFTGYGISEPSYQGIQPKIGLNIGIGL